MALDPPRVVRCGYMLYYCTRGRHFMSGFGDCTFMGMINTLRILYFRVRRTALLLPKCYFSLFLFPLERAILVIAMTPFPGKAGYVRRSRTGDVSRRLPFPYGGPGRETRGWGRGRARGRELQPTRARPRFPPGACQQEFNASSEV